MKTIAVDQIREAVSSLLCKANVELSGEMRQAIRAGAENETSALARNTLLRILENAEVARACGLPLCQDTGLAVVFVELGQDVHILGGALADAINDGVRDATAKGFLRASVTADPLQRKNSGDNTPAVIHLALTQGDQCRLQILAKGGGCENMSRFKMLTPADGRQGVLDFVLETVRLAGPNACPPIIVGVGVGGSFEQSAILSKQALLRPLGARHSLSHVAALEEELFTRINQTGIGPQGYGGRTTSLAVHVEVGACHVASLPVSVNIECHAHRHQEIVL